KDFINELKTEIKKQGVDARVFIGGSFAKGTLIKKKKYDVDVFIRFSNKYTDSEISIITKNILEKIRKPQKVHGSREYYRVIEKDNLFFEIVPVIKINKPEEARNTTDLSYFHVRYLNKKLKTEKIKDEIRIAKSFCNYNKCYGAESYIKGFSGYALELLVYYYGSFEKFIREIIKIKEKEVIDIEKHHKTKRKVMINLNTSKLKSPIILIDPTFKQRNALAALSEKTFYRFQEICRSFIKNPHRDYFKTKKTDIQKIKNKAKKSKKEFILIEANTGKPEGDIAGGKLLKFYSILSREISRFFEIHEKGFNYNEKKSARYYFLVKPNKKIIQEGPFKKDKKNLQRFIKKHKDVFEKGKKVYSKEQVNFNLKDFIQNWKKNNKRTIKDMDINTIKIIEFQN
ncbi:MAG: nucleotidyltransferase domain-containing protein, partial [Minisyncoccales bacterium]